MPNFSKTGAYYNEIDPFAAAWLCGLIKAGHIADGEVDTRSIEDIQPNEIQDFTQHHFFAGIGGWSYALRLAGWSDDRPVITGSCPCQPFSTAGKRTGTTDKRHLWPALYHHIRCLKPATVFGEQVASKDGLAWFDTVQTDLEVSGYTVEAADLCAAGVGAPHIRQRLYFCGRLANSSWPARLRPERWSDEGFDTGGSGEAGLVAHADERVQREAVGSSKGEAAVRRSGYGFVDNPASKGLAQRPSRAVLRREALSQLERPSDISAWEAHDEIGCVDGRTRHVEPGTFPLAHGVPNRVGRLRGYGNAIVPQVAAEFIKAIIEGNLRMPGRKK